MRELKTKQLVRKMFNNKEVTPRKIQEWAHNKSKEGKNLLIVSPTGSGKTEASYLASRHWDRTVYALPMTTLATSIHNRLNTYEERLTGKDWSLQHSESTEDKWLSNDRTVTTIDQVLSGYYGFGRESFIRGKNVMRSSLILDEVQLFDPESALLSLLNLLHQTTGETFNNNFCIMTATFPSSLRTYLKEHFNVDIYVEEAPSTDKQVTLNWEDKMPISSIVEHKEKQIIVCNTQSQQIKLIQELKDKGIDEERLIVLNSRLYPNHRKETEKQVLDHFGSNSNRNNKILISTQIVEAGMDISANTLYSYEAPIDSLVQREGRTCRWGGKGQFIVVKQEKVRGKHFVYNTELVDNTSEIIKQNINELFSWNKQLKWIDMVLDPLYKRILSKMYLQFFRKNVLADGSSKTLIRNMQTVNVIPIENYPIGKEEDFNNHSISLPIYVVKEGLILEREGVKKTSHIQTGDTLLVDAAQWSYDVAGLREGDGMTPLNILKIKKCNEEKYGGYIEETLKEHLEETAKQMVKTVKKDNIIKGSTELYDVWKIGAAHDIGKATENWQKMIRYSREGNTGKDNILYAHRPWEPRPNASIKDRNHSLIGTQLLEDQLTSLEKQVIRSHHGRLFNIQSKSLRTTYWDKNTNKLLKELKFSPEILKTESHSYSKKDMLNPTHHNWSLFVYLTGTLMEADRKAINEVKAQKIQQHVLNSIFKTNNFRETFLIYPFIDKTPKLWYASNTIKNRMKI